MMPGGKNSDGEANLKTMSFTIEQEKFVRYTSSKQYTVESGSLMISYQDTLINLTAVQSRDYDDYKNWSFINGKILLIK